MKKVLCVDCCIRGAQSRTRQVEKAFLSALAARGEYTVEGLNLCEEKLLPLDAKRLAERDALLAQGNYEHPRFRFARQFAAADKIVIAAPFWNLSYPALLTTYIENVAMQGITFDCDAQNGCFGICRADKLLYISARGGIYADSPMECGAANMEQLCRFFGIDDFYCITPEGLDIGIEPVERILARAIAQAERLAQTF